jgi:hypothetical protein
VVAAMQHRGPPADSETRPQAAHFNEIQRSDRRPSVPESPSGDVSGFVLAGLGKPKLL